MRSEPIQPCPFLKWAGSKKQLLEPIKKRMLECIAVRPVRVFVDGFLGSGAVMFMVLNDLVEFGNIMKIVANDSNHDLVGCFKTVKCRPKDLLDELKRIERGFRSSHNPQSYYLGARKYFNDRQTCRDSVERSALFIFLNHTCFNGLYRVNASGEFNVPYGHNPKAKIYSEEILEVDSAAFNSSNVVFACGDFQIHPKLYAHRPDETLFYFDPPYRPLTPTSSFSKYTKSDFGEAEQDRLAKYCVGLCNDGAGVIASNSDTSDDYYKTHYNRFRIEKVQVVRMLNADVKKRGKISEVLLSCF